jgi:hypothetical protein
MRRHVWLIINAILILLAYFTPLSATIRTVPSEYSTIQAGIDAAGRGDTVLIASGVYSGAGNYDLTTAGKTILVIGYLGADSIVIDGDSTHLGFGIVSNETEIRGLTFRDCLTGIACQGNSPIIDSCVFINNINYGVLFQANGFPLLRGNYYASASYGIAVTGGYINSAGGAWQNDNGEPYVILGDIYIGKNYNFGIATLTLAKGITLEFADSAGIQVGYRNSSGYAGQLIALGSADSFITFTSLSAEPNGWDGIFYHDFSDLSGAQSTMNYCIIENAGRNGWNMPANIYCSNTSQPILSNCIIRNSSVNGIVLDGCDNSIYHCRIDSNAASGIISSGSSSQIRNCEVNANGIYGINCNGYSSSNIDSCEIYGDSIGINCSDSYPTISVNSIHDSFIYGIYLVGNACPAILSNIFDNNILNIVVGNCMISTSNAKWYYAGGEPYNVLGNIVIGDWGVWGSLTIEPGTILKFASNTGIQVGDYRNNTEYRGEFRAVGTPESLIVFTSLSGDIGAWKGILFNNRSQYGNLSSILNHCIIEKGGQTGFNVSCDNTNQPIINECMIIHSGGDGIYLNNSDITISDCVIDSNSQSGIRSQISYRAASIISNLIFDNGEDGIFNAGIIDSNNVYSNSRYGIHCTTGSPTIEQNDISRSITGICCDNRCFPLIRGNSIHNNSQYGLYAAACCPELRMNNYINNNIYNIVLGGGNIEADRILANDGGEPYIVLGSIIVVDWASIPSLTIEPGVTMKFADSTFLQVGGEIFYSHYPGELHAIGTTDSTISFTSLSGSPGGWQGIRFTHYSDNNTTSSFLEHCIIEKATKGVGCYMTNQPLISHCRITKSSQAGIDLYNNASPTIRETSIDSNGINGIQGTFGCSPVLINDSIFVHGESGVHFDAGSTALIESCTIIDNEQYGLFLYSASPVAKFNRLNRNNIGIYLASGSFPQLENNNYNDNILYGIAVAGQTISGNGTWYNDGEEPYVVLNDVTIGKGQGGIASLQIEPGSVIKFLSGAGLIVGFQDPVWNYPWPGELTAIGNPDSQITFTSFDGTSNGWKGIYFTYYSDYAGAQSDMSECIVENAGQSLWGGEANIICHNTSQPSFQNCIIRNSGAHGVFLDASEIKFKNCLFENNDSCGIYCQSHSKVIIGDSAQYRCELFDNGTYEVFNNQDDTVLAQYNYWGTPDSTEIATRIYDKYDNPSDGPVIFGPFYSNIDHDAEILTILSPDSLLGLDTTIIPKALIINRGRVIDTIPVIFEIGTVYRDSVSIILIPGDTSNIIFSPWTAVSAGSFVTRCVSLLPSDGFTHNDTAISVVAIFNNIEAPIVYAIIPNSGGNTGYISSMILGEHFATGVKVSLFNDFGQAIIADSISTHVLSGDTITCVLDLRGAQLGLYHLQILNPDSLSSILRQAFTIESGSSRFWIDLIGPPNIREGWKTRFELIYGNAGNIDINQAVITLHVPTSVILQSDVASAWPADSGNFASNDIGFTSVLIPSHSQGSIPFYITPYSYHGIFNIEINAWENPISNYDSLSVIKNTTIGKNLLADNNYSSNEMEETPESWPPQPPEEGSVIFQEDHGTGHGPSTGHEGIIYKFEDETYVWENLPGGGTRFTPWLDFCKRTYRNWPDMTNSGWQDTYNPRLSDNEKSVLRAFMCDHSSERVPPICPNPGTPMPYIFPFLKCTESVHTAFNAINRDLIPGHHHEIWDAPSFDYLLLTGRPWLGPTDSPIYYQILGLLIYGIIDELPQVATHILLRMANVVRAIDPEAKYGISGYDKEETPLESLKRYVPLSRSLDYRIEFWNRENASAPTQSVFIQDTLDANYNLSSFRFSNIGFQKWNVELNSSQNFNVDIDMRPDDSLIVNITGSIDYDTRILKCTFRSLDPVTYLPPEDPMRGFLPAVDSLGINIGWINYKIYPLLNLNSGSTIANQAYINFDSVGEYNPAPINGPFINTIDSDTPLSHVNSLPESTTAGEPLVVTWTGADSASGIVSYQIFMADSTSELYGNDYSLWITTGDSSALLGFPQVGHIYSFYSIATDGVGYQEAKKDTVEAQIKITGPPPCSYIPGDINGNGAANGIDVTYGVSYLKGGNAPPDSCNCPPQAFPFYATGDANGNCAFNGIDITYFVAYLKGGAALRNCPDCPPATLMNPPVPAVEPTRAPILKSHGTIKTQD